LVGCGAVTYPLLHADNVFIHCIVLAACISTS
jgi:hypothetical protein